MTDKIPLIALLALNNMDYESIRLQLGDPRERIKHEIKQSKSVYICHVVLFLIAAILALSTKFTDNPWLLLFIAINFVLSLTLSYLVRKINIKEIPKDKEIVENLTHDNEIDKTIKYLESKISILDFYKILPASKSDNWLFNIGFSGFFSLILFVTEKATNQIESIIWALLFYAYAVLFFKIKNFYRPKPIYITLNALSVIEKYK